MLNKEWDVLAALAEGRQVQIDEVDAIEEVLAEGLVLHHRPQVGIRGTNHPDIRTARVAVAQHLVGLVLQHAQQLHLAGKRQFANLIQEDGATFRQLEATDAVGCGIGEGTFLMAEHLTLEQR